MLLLSLMLAFEVHYTPTFPFSFQDQFLYPARVPCTSCATPSVLHLSHFQRHNYQTLIYRRVVLPIFPASKAISVKVPRAVARPRLQEFPHNVCCSGYRSTPARAQRAILSLLPAGSHRSVSECWLDEYYRQYVSTSRADESIGAHLHSWW